MHIAASVEAVLFTATSFWIGWQSVKELRRRFRSRRGAEADKAIDDKAIDEALDELEAEVHKGSGPYRKAAEKDEAAPKASVPSSSKSPPKVLLAPQKRCPRCGNGRSYTSTDKKGQTYHYSPYVRVQHESSEEAGCASGPHAHARCIWCHAEWLEHSINKVSP